MLPLTLSAAVKLQSLLSTSSALQTMISNYGLTNNESVPDIDTTQIQLSSATPDLADLVEQFSYPRISIYSSSVKNSHLEKFRSLSGSITIVAEIWSSGNLLTDTDRWIHYYVDAVVNILQANEGDWGDGFFYTGIFDIQFQSPKRGGFGFMQMARVSCELLVSRN